MKLEEYKVTIECTLQVDPKTFPQDEIEGVLKEILEGSNEVPFSKSKWRLKVGPVFLDPKDF